MRVLDRNEKHVLCNDSVVRQVDAVARDDRKAARIAARATLPNLMRDAAGNVYTSTLLQKLAAVVITRLASFSPSGLGLDMEAGRPGWHDSINGLPGIFGSSTSEQFQLQRLIEFLLQSLGEVIERNGPLLNLPEELDGLRNSVAAALTAYEHDGDSVRDFNYWDRTTSAKEQYRARVRDGFSGTEVDIALSELEKFLVNGLAHVRRALVRAVDERSGLPLTYYRHDPEAWEPVRGEDNKAKRHPLGTPVRVTAFKVRPLPLFLEGILHSMRTQAENPEAGRELHRKLRASPLFDRDLGMYIVGDSVKDCGPEVGRIWAWSPGWFENENVFLHAEHKYILNCLRAGLCDQAWADFRNCALPFQPMDRLGRNPMENASFIMSSRQPNEGYAGRAYQPRSSGTTAEVLEFMLLALFGTQPFRTDAAGRVVCELEPRLPPWMFTTDSTVHHRIREDGTPEEIELPAGSCAALFLGRCLVIYENPARKATFGLNPVRVTGYNLLYSDDREYMAKGPVLNPEHAAALRSGMVSRLHVPLK